MAAEAYRIDFSMSRGHEMVIDRPSGILREELDEVEVGMLQAQRIPKLLPPEWVDIDGAVTFRYLLSGKRMLSHRLQLAPLTMIDFYALLLAVVEAIDDCQHYMLRPESFLLHEQYVFVGEQWEDIGLVYLPLKNAGAGPSAGEAVTAMAVRWIGYVEQPDGAGLQRVFQHLREDRVSWNGLRQALLALLSRVNSFPASGTALAGKRQALQESSQAPVPISADAQQPQERHDRLLAEKLKRVARISLRNESNQADFGHSGGAADSNPEGERRKLPDEGMPVWQDINESAELEPAGRVSRMKKLSFAGCIVVVALIWRFLYMDSPTNMSLLVSAGLTVLAPAGLLLIWRRITNNNEFGDDEAENSSWMEKGRGMPEDADNSFPLGLEKGGGVKDRFRWEAGTWEENEQPVSERGQPEGEDQVNSFKGSLPARQQEATMLLGSDSRNGSGPDKAVAVPWLAREADGITERVALAERVIIGRSSEGTTYVDKAPGVSRAHLELVDENGGWIVKDIGSRNGSTINGEAMIPYKTYCLSNGDVLQLAGDKGPKYKFRTG